MLKEEVFDRVAKEYGTSIGVAKIFSLQPLEEVRDEFELNPLGSHPVWMWKAKRYDFSHEPGSPGPGLGNNALDDNDVLEQEADKNFDYDIENPCSNTDVYGEY